MDTVATISMPDTTDIIIILQNTDITQEVSITEVILQRNTSSKSVIRSIKDKIYY